MTTVPRYRHVGTQPIVVAGREVRPGEEFSAVLPEAQRDFFIRIGAIESLADQPDAADDGPRDLVVEEE